MLTTIWMCTQEWSLIFIRATALTFETCHHAFSCGSLLARSRTRRSLRLPRSGRRIRMPAIASAGVSRVSRTASAETGPSMRCSISGSIGRPARRSVAVGGIVGHPGHPRTRRFASVDSAARSGAIRLEAGELAAGMRERLAEAGAVRRVVEPRARAGGMRQRDHDRVVDEVALADALGQRLRADDRAGREAADREHERGAEQPQLLGRATGRRGGARRGSACDRRARRVSGPGSSASPRRSRRWRRTSPRRARASGAGCGLPGRARGRLPLPRRCPAPGRRGTPAGPAARARPARLDLEAGVEAEPAVRGLAGGP